MAVDFIQKSAGNSASTTLSSSVSNTDTSFPLTSDTNFLSGGGLVIVDEGEATEELAYYTGKSGASLTVPLANRGLEGGSPQAHSAGATVKGVLSADMWNNFAEALLNLVLVTTGALDTTKVVDLTTAQTLTTKTLTSPKIGTNIKDTNGNELITLTATGSAVNEVTYANAATGNAPSFTASGDDTNIDLNLKGKGTGEAKLYNYDDSTYYSAGEFLNDSLYRQAIINGNFGVWQRGTSIVPTATSYGPDRWIVYRNTTGSTVSRQDGTGVAGSQYCARVQRDNGNAATNGIGFYQGLESSSSIPFVGQKLTLSFWARKGANYSATSDALSFGINSGTGTDQNFVTGFTNNASIASGTATLTTSWQKFTCTTSSVVASNVTQLAVIFDRTCVGTAGAADYFEITQVQLCAGSVALPFMPKSYEEELRACQRYYERQNAGDAYTDFGCGVAYATNAANIFLKYYPKRISPTCTISNLELLGAGGTTCTAGTMRSGPTTAGLQCEVSGTPLTVNNAYVLRSSNNTAGYIDFSAEL